MPAFESYPSTSSRDVSSSNTAGLDGTVSSGSQKHAYPASIIAHLICTHIYAVTSIVILAAVVVVHLSLLARVDKSEKRPSLPSSSTHCARPELPLSLIAPFKRSSRESGSWSRVSGDEKKGVSCPETDEWSYLRGFKRPILARRAGGFGETSFLQTQLTTPQQQRQKQQKKQDPGSRRQRPPCAMGDGRSRGVSTDGAWSGVRLSQSRSFAAATAADAAVVAAEKGAGQPYRVPPPFPSLVPRLQAAQQSDVGSQVGSIMEGVDSWSGVVAPDAHAPGYADNDAPSTTLAPAGSATAVTNKLAFSRSSSSPVSVPADSSTAAAARAAPSPECGTSRLSPVRLEPATPRQFHFASQRRPSSQSPAGFALQDRHASYAASMPHELDSSAQGLSFIHQPNPDYSSGGGPGSAPGSGTGLLSRQSSSSTSAEFVTSGSQVFTSVSRPVPRRRSYNKMGPPGSELGAVSVAGGQEGAWFESSPQQWQEEGSSASASGRFGPSSFPSAVSPHLPPPPPGPDDYGRDATFFASRYTEYAHPPASHQHGDEQQSSLSHHQQEHGHGSAHDVHEEVVDMVDESGASWKRHTRVYGSGVCLACQANGGGFYGANVPLEQRVPR